MIRPGNFGVGLKHPGDAGVAVSGTWERWWLTGAGLFQFFADNRSGSRVYVMDLAARETGHGLIDVVVLGDVFGDKALHAVSGLGAAVDEEGHVLIL
jgi:hypothetical protein